MNRNILWGTVAVSLLLILAALAAQSEANFDHSRPQLSLPASKLIANNAETQLNPLVNINNRFGFNLFAQLRQQSTTTNITVSPQSIAIALAMLRNGTTGTTQAEMTQTLGLQQIDPQIIDPSYLQLMTTWQSSAADVELAIANSLWVNQDISLKEPFLNTSQNFYQGTINKLNFADPAAKNTINQWVASNTLHQIPQIIDAISAEDALHLINAIYFKGSWTEKFDPSATQKQLFHLGTEATKPVAMMSQTGTYRYYENQQFQVIRLPYGEQGKLGMYVFLPRKNSSLEQFHQQLNLANWQQWLSQMRSQPGHISLPKFKLEYATDLTKVLSALGMPQIFNSAQANFSPMTDSKVAINQLKHKAVIEVNEEGTEAAGVTSIGIRISSATPQEQGFEININRPFFFAISDDLTETIFFMGDVVEPTAV